MNVSTNIKSWMLLEGSAQIFTMVWNLDLSKSPFLRYSNFKISRLYINVRVSRYVLCLQRLLFVENVLFLSARLSIHITIGVKNGIWSKILQYYPIFHVVISGFDIFIWPTSHVLCLYKLSFILKIHRMGGNCFAYVIIGVKNVS